MLLSAVRAAEKDTSNPYLSRERQRVETSNITIYMMKKDPCVLSCSLSTDCPSNLTVATMRGFSWRRISRTPDLSRIMSLATFRPPPVEPAQAPQNMSKIRIVCENPGHSVKSELPKPVELDSDATVKPAYRSAFENDLYIGAILNVIIMVQIM